MLKPASSNAVEDGDHTISVDEFTERCDMAQFSSRMLLYVRQSILPVRRCNKSMIYDLLLFMANCIEHIFLSYLV